MSTNRASCIILEKQSMRDESRGERSVDGSGLDRIIGGTGAGSGERHSIGGGRWGRWPATSCRRPDRLENGKAARASTCPLGRRLLSGQRQGEVTFRNWTVLPGLL